MFGIKKLIYLKNSRDIMKHYNVKYSNFIVNSLDEYIRLDPNHEFG